MRRIVVGRSGIRHDGVEKAVEGQQRAHLGENEHTDAKNAEKINAKGESKRNRERANLTSRGAESTSSRTVRKSLNAADKLSQSQPIGIFRATSSPHHHSKYIRHTQCYLLDDLRPYDRLEAHDLLI